MRGLAIAALRWCWICEAHVGQFLWNQGLQDAYSVLLQFTCVVILQWFFETILLNVRRSVSVSVDFRFLLLFAGVVFPWFVYADITVETVALGTPNNVAAFVTNAPAKRTPTVCPPLKSDKSPILSRRLSLNTITNALAQTLRSVNKRNKNIQCCQVKFFQCIVFLLLPLLLEHRASVKHRFTSVS
jgi:hypothetical protein